MTRYLHLVVAVVFSCFAWVQLDDPDNFLWIVIYGIVALNAILVFAGKGSRNFSILITLFILLCLILNTRGFLVWWHAGQPSIMSESAAGEEIREWLGLSLALLVSVVYNFQGYTNKDP